MISKVAAEQNYEIYSLNTKKNRNDYKLPARLIDSTIGLSNFPQLQIPKNYLVGTGLTINIYSPDNKHHRTFQYTSGHNITNLVTTSESILNLQIPNEETNIIYLPIQDIDKISAYSTIEQILNIKTFELLSNQMNSESNYILFIDIEFDKKFNLNNNIHFYFPNIKLTIEWINEKEHILTTLSKYIFDYYPIKIIPNLLVVSGATIESSSITPILSTLHQIKFLPNDNDIYVVIKTNNTTNITFTLDGILLEIESSNVNQDENKYYLVRCLNFIIDTSKNIHEICASFALGINLYEETNKIDNTKYDWFTTLAFNHLDTQSRLYQDAIKKLVYNTTSHSTVRSFGINYNQNRLSSCPNEFNPNVLINDF
jgi:hypothetical protein